MIELGTTAIDSYVHHEDIVHDLTRGQLISIELPAGTGKTELVAQLASVCSSQSLRTLILTHTHAGVAALKARTHRKYSVARESCRIRTVASWAFDVVRSYPILSAFDAPEIFDPPQSAQYYAACLSALNAKAIRETIQASYNVVIVDEYQDCSLGQHRLIAAIAAIVPTVVLGDRLQSIFNFGGDQAVSWDNEVISTFNPASYPSIPYRWQNKNPELGDWLISIRAQLLAGEPIDLSSGPVTHITTPSTIDIISVYSSWLQPLNTSGDSIVALSRYHSDRITAARQFNGELQLMETLEGREILDLLNLFEFEDTVVNDPNVLATAVVRLIEGCSINLTNLLPKDTALRVLTGAQLVPNYEHEVEACLVINNLLAEPTPHQVRQTLEVISRLEGFVLYRSEAWNEVLRAFDAVIADPSLSLSNAVKLSRNDLRKTGRFSDRKVVSRPLLVKGLEFDHAILLDADRYSAEGLYVALTRASKSLAVISRFNVIHPRSERLIR